MGKCVASGYIPPAKITICDGCFHRDVCDDRDYLTENKCSARAGGCRCGECKYWKRAVNTLDRQLVDWGFCEKFLDSDSEEEINTVEKDFCSYGEPREAQDDG